jgi:hypothetical protein
MGTPHDLRHYATTTKKAHELTRAPSETYLSWSAAFNTLFLLEDRFLEACSLFYLRMALVNAVSAIFPIIVSLCIAGSKLQ